MPSEKTSGGSPRGGWHAGRPPARCGFVPSPPRAPRAQPPPRSRAIARRARDAPVSVRPALPLPGASSPTPSPPRPDRDAIDARGAFTDAPTRARAEREDASRRLRCRVLFARPSRGSRTWKRAFVARSASLWQAGGSRGCFTSTKFRRHPDVQAGARVFFSKKHVTPIVRHFVTAYPYDPRNDDDFFPTGPLLPRTRTVSITGKNAREVVCLPLMRENDRGAAWRPPLPGGAD